MIYPENILILAPLSGFTDLPYRQSAYRGGCRYAFTEMVDAASLAYANAGGEKLLQCSEFERENFIATQLVGSDPELLKRACDKLNSYEYFSLLDFNLGCPVPKVVKKGAGAALGRKIDLALECFEVLTRYSRFPLTAKMRILHYEDPAPTLELCRGLVALGAQALTIHGRTMEHFYTGTVNFSIIKAVKDAFPQIPVIANGGVCSKETYDEMRQKSGCSRVMLAQGAMAIRGCFGNWRAVRRRPLRSGEKWFRPTSPAWSNFTAKNPPCDAPGKSFTIIFAAAVSPHLCVISLPHSAPKRNLRNCSLPPFPPPK